MRIQMSGVEHVSVAPEQAFAFVTDPNRVGRCMPDLDELQVSDSRHFVAVVKVGVGPVRGRLKIEAEMKTDDARLGDLDLTAKGSGMGSGMVLTSHMHIEPTGGGGAELQWSAETSVSGPLASVGGRLLEGQAKKKTQAMFDAIRQALQANGAPAGS